MMAIGPVFGEHRTGLGAYDTCPIRSLTQEDPIGLAGGLNLYGFANGDPVNFRDPFGLCPRITYAYNRQTGKYDATIALNLVFKSGSPADQTAVHNNIQKFWAGVHGTYNVTVNLNDSSAPTYEVEILQQQGQPHGEGRSWPVGRGGYIKLWSPSGTASGAGSQLIAHEFGHAAGIDYHDDKFSSSVMHNPPGSVVDAGTVGAIIEGRCNEKRIDDEEDEAKAGVTILK
jgi:hypothetical protein